MLSFDPYTQPIRGTHSIEASAGTGKTYSITILWLRLLLEENLSIEQILVSTFTQAATAELKERLLSSLHAALKTTKELEQSLTPTQCPELSVIRALVDSNKTSLSAVIRTVSKAISSFDLAPISTIHGFCQSLISRHALELGCDADLSLSADCEEILQQIADDEIMLLAEDPAITPDQLRSIAQKVAEHPKTPRVGADPNIHTELESVKDSILKLRERVLSAIKNTNTKNAVARRIDALEIDSVWKEIEEKQVGPDNAEFLKLWNRYRELQNDAARIPYTTIADAVSLKLPQRKNHAGTRTFDDILFIIQEALFTQGQDGRLAQVVRKRLKAAIIDECQDSDSVQIYVFDQLFRNPQTVSFIVIGDPKQSIYRFRGADLASYKQLASASGVTKAPVMMVNYRSDEPLITALNSLYGHHFSFPDALSRDEQTFYVPVSAKATESRIQDPEALPALVFQWSDSGRRENAKNDIAAQIASECTRLLSQGVQIQDRHSGKLRSVRLGDIAVLARGHRDLGIVRRALTQQGITSQSGGKSLGSVFGSDEATDVLAWLHLLEALRTRRNVLTSLVTFLGTPLGGFTAEQLRDLRERPILQTEYTAFFQVAAAEFPRSGPLPLLLQHLSESRTVKSNLPFADAERRYTNWQHVAALLQHEHARGRRSPETLLLWLSRQIASKAESTGSPDSAESAMMKLETDAEAVQLVTIHNSKGLEYPITFCPFLWDVMSMPMRKSTPAALVREQSRWLLDIGSPRFDANQRTQFSQEDEEEHRKLYVALTRSRHRVYIGMAAIDSGGAQFDNSAKKSALAHLLRLQDLSFSEWKDALSQVPHAALVSNPTLETPPHHSITESLISDLSPPPKSEPYHFAFQRTHSFSSLSKSDDDHFSPADRDADPSFHVVADASNIDPLQPLGAAGAILGDSLHTVLEEYLGNRRDLKTAIGSRDPFEDWERAITTILSTPINLPESKPTNLEMVRSGCITEMQFHLPASHVTSVKLSEALLADPAIGASEARHDWAASIQNWNFGHFAGFLQGYIDLIFEHEGRWYVADYKSNKLPDYRSETLEQAMLQKSYMLQARFYALALHRHLSTQLPGYTYEDHFGGVVYLFVRGFPSDGVWTERPSLAALEALGILFTPSR
ncbi:MAG: UvrD-helicase domain-containing protein [Verrucomicrobiota bacterium]